MQYTINDLKNIAIGKAADVYEIFQNFFGEANTDIQDIPSDDDIKYWLSDRNIQENNETYECNDTIIQRLKNNYKDIKPQIFVWWPTVVITNENNYSTIIKDLYAKIGITTDGLIPYENNGFLLGKATYSAAQFQSGYIHSHLPPFSYSYGEIPKFQRPCLGTGPINHTIMDLKNEYEDSLWMLFCQELSLYVTVESLRGGPYIRMESIGASKKLNDYGKFTEVKTLDNIFPYRIPRDSVRELKNMILSFIPYYLKNGNLMISYHNERFDVGMSYYDFIIDISNSFIDYFNKNGESRLKQLLDESTMIVYSKISNGVFYDSSYSNTDMFESKRGTYLFDFKGSSVTLNIEPSIEEEDIPATILLNHKVAMYILDNILKTINYNYKNERFNDGGTAQEGVSSTNKAVYYI